MEGGLEEPKNYKPKDKILKKKSGGKDQRDKLEDSAKLEWKMYLSQKN